MKKDFLSRTNIMSARPLPAATAERRGSLTVLSGTGLGTVFPLPSSEAFIGRDPQAHVQLDDDNVSRRHARITPCQERYLLDDLGSTNGTYVDGERLDQPLVLTEGARIQMGTTVLQFAMQDRLQQEASQRMYDLAVRDGLTGLYNRRHFEERLTSEFAFASRHGTPLGLIMVDVDHFKQVNDTWGHTVGDTALQQVARTLQTSVRLEDIAARYGGEEFVVLLRGIPANGVRALADRLRGLVSQAPVPASSETIHVTASFGVSHNTFGLNQARHLVLAADAALYEAKRIGRDCVAGPAALDYYARQDKRKRQRARRQTTTRTDS